MSSTYTSLNRCLECGGSVSSAANACPHCGRPSPQLVMRCIACTNPMHMSNRRVDGVDKYGRQPEGALTVLDSVVPYRYLDEDVTTGAWYTAAPGFFLIARNPIMHLSCLEALSAEQRHTCKTCGNSILRSFGLIEHDTPWECAKCGERIDNKICMFCDLSINPETAVGLGNRFGSRPLYSHEYCLANRQQSKSKSSAPCFIATAALDSASAPSVITLQMLRDEILRTHFLGRSFIAAYEFTSPPVAKLIAKSYVLKLLVRFLIIFPATWLAKLVLHFHAPCGPMRPHQKS